ncbi:MAG: hypothetical protein DHS20C03_33950 [Minwuia thermotolerans]|nr:MAG: hypothetical protein DHS20C03_33950 [Minwuia thermotolerans]
MKQLEWFVTGIVILALAVVGVLYLTSGRSPEEAKVAERQSTITTGIRAMLDDLSGLQVITLVPGVQVSAGEWDFRGSAEADGRTEPFYGIAQLVCDRIQTRANCWRLVRLDRDGRSVIGRDDVTALPSATASGNGGTAAAPEAGNLRTETVTRRDPEPTIESETAPSAPAQPATIWRVTGATVNGRAGPGTSFPIVARLGQDHRLERLELDEGWGHYQILEPAADAGQEIWVWADLVSEAQ